MFDNTKNCCFIGLFLASKERQYLCFGPSSNVIVVDHNKQVTGYMIIYNKKKEK